MTLIPDTILRALCWALLHSLWQGLILALVAGLILVLTKKASSALRYNLLCCGMILFLIVSGYTFYSQLRAVDTSDANSAAATHTVPGSPGAGIGDTGGSNSVTNAAQQGTYTLRNAIDGLVEYFDTHAAMVVVIWFILFLARFVKLLSGLVYAQRIRYYQTSLAPAEWRQRFKQLLAKLKITRPILLLESTLIQVPVVVGYLKPAVLVPVGMLAHLPADQVESILLHELAHIRRKDYLFNLVQHIIDTLFFFNPALIWISSLIRTERENCCDDIAIRETRSRRQLIEALVSFHEYRQRENEFAMGFAGTKENPVVKRVKRIVHKTNHSLNIGERVVLMSGLLIVCAAFVTINTAKKAVYTKPQPIPTVQKIDTTVKEIKKDPAPAPKKPIATRPSPEQTTTVQSVKQEETAPPGDTGSINYLGFQNLTLDKLIGMKEHGVTADFILSLRKLGYTDLTPDQAIQLVDHGVNIEFVRYLIGLGFKQPPLHKFVDLRDHGVTSEYISACKNKFGKLLELNDYIKLRDAGINPTE
jgi:beta-lactamase regulating signal transducer with metallopeptidase domain